MARGRLRLAGSRRGTGVCVKRCADARCFALALELASAKQQARNLNNSLVILAIAWSGNPHPACFSVRISCTCLTPIRPRICEEYDPRSTTSPAFIGYSSCGSWARAGHQDGGNGRTPRPVEKPSRHEKTLCCRRVKPGRVCDERRSGLRRLVLPRMLRQVGRVCHAI
jgi:hypothetical protein